MLSSDMRSNAIHFKRQDEDTEAPFAYKRQKMTEDKVCEKKLFRQGKGCWKSTIVNDVADAMFLGKKLERLIEGIFWSIDEGINTNAKVWYLIQPIPLMVISHREKCYQDSFQDSSPRKTFYLGEEDFPESPLATLHQVVLPKFQAKTGTLFKINYKYTSELVEIGPSLQSVYLHITLEDDCEIKNTIELPCCYISSLYDHVKLYDLVCDFEQTDIEIEDSRRRSEISEIEIVKSMKKMEKEKEKRTYIIAMQDCYNVICPNGSKLQKAIIKDPELQKAFKGLNSERIKHCHFIDKKKSFLDENYHLTYTRKQLEKLEPEYFDEYPGVLDFFLDNLPKDKLRAKVEEDMDMEWNQM
jgi:hypothetical protein